MRQAMLSNSRRARWLPKGRRVQAQMRQLRQLRLYVRTLHLQQDIPYLSPPCGYYDVSHVCSLCWDTYPVSTPTHIAKNRLSHSRAASG